MLGACSLPRHALDVRATADGRDLSDSERALIEQGIELHDAGDLEGARVRYSRVLETNPASAVARYQKALAYVHGGDDERCLENAVIGARMRSDTRAELLHLAGVCLDNLGRTEDALPMLVQATTLRPELHQFHYSRALVEDRLGYYDQALESLHRALSAHPYHASSHLQLGYLNHGLGKRYPAFLAYTFFLLLEAETERSAGARTYLIDLLQNIGERREGSGTTISLDIGILTGESSPSRQAELMFALLGVHRSLPEMQDSTEHELLVSMYRRVFALTVDLVSDDDVDSSDITWTLHAPFFGAVHEAGFTEVVANLALAGSEVAGVEEWLEENEEALDRFFVWVESVLD